MLLKNSTSGKLQHVVAEHGFYSKDRCKSDFVTIQNSQDVGFVDEP